MSWLYKFGPFRLSGNLLFRGDEVVRITPKQADILHFLIENRKRSVSGNEILEKCWPVPQDENVEPKYVELNNVTQNISGLRKKLDDDPKKEKYIATTGSGYRFVAKDLEVVEVADEGDNPDERPPTIEGRQAAGQQAAVNIDSAENFPGQGGVEAEHIARPGPAAFASESSEDKEITFRELWRNANEMILWFVCAVITSTAALSVAGLILNWPKTKLYVSVPQLFMVVIAVAYIPRGPTKIREGLDEASRHRVEETLRRYKLYWRMIWGTWLILYLCLVFVFVEPDSTEWKQRVSVCTILFNNLNTAVLVLCYYILNQPKKGKQDISDLHWILGALVAAYLVVEILTLVLVSDHYEREVLLYGLSLVSGIVGGIGMALYVGRLQSKFLGPSPPLAIALYSYTAIQSLFIFLVGFPKGKEVFAGPTETLIGVILINIALILKCLLYLYMARLFQSGDLLFYFVKVRHTYLNVDQERQEFRKFLK